MVTSSRRAISCTVTSSAERWSTRTQAAVAVASVRVGVMVHNSYEVMLLHLAAALRSPRARMVVRSGL